MSLPLMLNLGTLLLLVVVPGWFLYHGWLSRVGLSWRVSVALVLAIETVLFSDIASLFRYSFLLMLGVSAALIGFSLAVWYFGKKASADQGSKNILDWPSILGHIFTFGVFIAPAFILFLPLDTDAQGFGYLALMVRKGGTVWTLAPWHPEVHYLYSPALFVWSAYLSDLLKLPLHQVMLPFASCMAGLTTLLGVDLAEFLLPGRTRARWLFPLTIMLEIGLFLTLMDSAYTTVLGFLFVALFLILAFWSLQSDAWWSLLLPAIALAAIALTHPDTIIILLIAYIPFYATFWLAKSQYRTWSVWLQLFVIIPAVGVVLTLPWIVRVWPLFFEASVLSPFRLSMSHLRQLILYQGVVVPLFAIVGLIIAFRRRTLPDLLMITWVIALIDFSLFGVVDALAAYVGIDPMHYVYPFSVAWHGPILVYPYLTTLAADSLLDRFHIRFSERLKVILPAAGIAALALIVIFQQPLLVASRGRLSFFGAFSSRADLAAMDYLRENTPPDSLILNYPVGFEGHWVPVIAERESVAFRDQPFFAGAQPLYDRNMHLKDVYFNLSEPGAHDLLIQYHVDYIVIPQIVAEPDRFDDIVNTLRWRWPEETWYPLQSLPADQNWLKLVFEQDGAQVWRVLP